MFNVKNLMDRKYIEVTFEHDGAAIDLGLYDAKEAAELSEQLITTVTELLDFVAKHID